MVGIFIMLMCGIFGFILKDMGFIFFFRMLILYCFKEGLYGVLLCFVLFIRLFILKKEIMELLGYEVIFMIIVLLLILYVFK